MSINVNQINETDLELVISHQLVTLQDIEMIKTHWQCLEKRSQNSIFLSWQWIENWLKVVTEPLYLVKANKRGVIVGLGIFVERKRYALGVIPYKQWWLHKTGDKKQDQMWIEYNDFLLDNEDSKTIRNKIVEYLFKEKKLTQEIVYGLTKLDVFDSFKEQLKIMDMDSRTLLESKGHLIDYNKVSTDDFSDLWSKNTRYQINRSKKILTQQGDISFRIITKTEEILGVFDNISDLHKKRWHNTKQGSGFSNALFKLFHERMITNNNEVLQISVLSLNNKDIGFLMNYVYKNTVYFYLSALSDEFSSKVKLGMLLHSESIKYYREQKIFYYDFLAGDAQYKRSLANEKYTMVINCYAPNSLIFKCEKYLRKVKHVLFK